MKQKIFRGACVLALAVPSASASMIIKIVDSGGNVQASCSGSLDHGATQGFGAIIPVTA